MSLARVRSSQRGRGTGTRGGGKSDQTSKGGKATPPAVFCMCTLRQKMEVKQAKGERLVQANMRRVNGMKGGADAAHPPHKARGCVPWTRWSAQSRRNRTPSRAHGPETIVQHLQTYLNSIGFVGRTKTLREVGGNQLAKYESGDQHPEQAKGYKRYRKARPAIIKGDANF